MGQVDYRQFAGGAAVVSHSAKGSTWEKHKYIKIINGLYFYPDDYVGGRHLSDAQKKQNKDGKGKDGKNDKSGGEDGKDDKDDKKTNKKIEKLANDVISGKYGNGKERMDKLGKKYEKVQHRVNQILLGKAGAKKVLERKKAAKKSTSTSSSKAKKTKKEKTKTLKK